MIYCRGFHVPRPLVFGRAAGCLGPTCPQNPGHLQPLGETKKKLAASSAPAGHNVFAESSVGRSASMERAESEKISSNSEI